jgi:hypothetical protein
MRSIISSYRFRARGWSATTFGGSRVLASRDSSCLRSWFRANPFLREMGEAILVAEIEGRPAGLGASE